TVSEMPSSWLPSRSVVSKISTDRGTSGVDKFQPVLVLVDLAPNGGEEDLQDAARDGTGRADLAVVDRADGHHLGGGAGEEGLVRGVEIAAEDVADLDRIAQVARDRHHRALRDAFERARARRRG